MGLIQLTFMATLGLIFVLLPVFAKAQTTAGQLIDYSVALLESESNISEPENVSHELSDNEVTVTCHIENKDDALKVMNETETLPEPERQRFTFIDIKTLPIEKGDLRESGYLVIYKRERH